MVRKNEGFDRNPCFARMEKKIENPPPLPTEGQRRGSEASRQALSCEHQQHAEIQLKQNKMKINSNQFGQKT